MLFLFLTLFSYTSLYSSEHNSNNTSNGSFAAQTSPYQLASLQAHAAPTERGDCSFPLINYHLNSTDLSTIRTETERVDAENAALELRLAQSKLEQAKKKRFELLQQLQTSQNTTPTQPSMSQTSLTDPHHQNNSTVLPQQQQNFLLQTAPNTNALEAPMATVPTLIQSQMQQPLTSAQWTRQPSMPQISLAYPQHQIFPTVLTQQQQNFSLQATPNTNTAQPSILQNSFTSITPKFIPLQMGQLLPPAQFIMQGANLLHCQQQYPHSSLMPSNTEQKNLLSIEQQNPSSFSTKNLLGHKTSEEKTKDQKKIKKNSSEVVIDDTPTPQRAAAIAALERMQESNSKKQAPKRKQLEAHEEEEEDSANIPPAESISYIKKATLAKSKQISRKEINTQRRLQQTNKLNPDFVKIDILSGYCCLLCQKEKKIFTATSLNSKGLSTTSLENHFSTNHQKMANSLYQCKICKNISFEKLADWHSHQNSSHTKDAQKNSPLSNHSTSNPTPQPANLKTASPKPLSHENRDCNNVEFYEEEDSDEENSNTVEITKIDGEGIIFEASNNPLIAAADEKDNDYAHAMHESSLEATSSDESDENYARSNSYAKNKKKWFHVKKFLNSTLIEATQPPTPSNAQYTCLVCKNKNISSHFGSFRNGVALHFKCNHNEHFKEMLRCTFCPKNFSSENGLSLHLSRHHSKKVNL